MEKSRTKRKQPRQISEVANNAPALGPLIAAILYAQVSALFTDRANARFPDNDLGGPVAKAIANRLNSNQGSNQIRSCAIGRYDFTMASKGPPSPAPFAGEAAVKTPTNWLEFVAFRGPSAPPLARYALVVFAEALGRSFTAAPSCRY